MLRVRPVHYTSKIAEFRTLFAALGLKMSIETEDWIEFDAASGRVALHRVEPGSSRDGQTVLGCEAGDLDRLADGLALRGGRAELVTADHGTALQITRTDGMTFLVDAHSTPSSALSFGPAGSAESSLSVLTLWMTPDVAGASEVLASLGVAPRISSTGGGWADFLAPDGGIVAAHHSDRVAVELSFECSGDLLELQRLLVDAGFSAPIIDESFARTLRLPNPDGGLEIWVNETQQDLYGYQKS